MSQHTQKVFVWHTGAKKKKGGGASCDQSCPRLGLATPKAEDMTPQPLWNLLKGLYQSSHRAVVSIVKILFPLFHVSRPAKGLGEWFCVSETCSVHRHRWEWPLAVDKGLMCLPYPPSTDLKALVHLCPFLMQGG